jgi:ABC-type glycerol-3-phosphate transport system substrate-binding protein
MLKRFFSIFLLCITLTLTGLGCKGLSQEETQAVRPVRLQYWTVYNDVEELRRIASQYKLLRPHVTVDIRRLRFEEFESVLLNALAEDTGPDIISVQNTAIRGKVSRLSPMPASVNMARLEVKGKYAKETVVTIEPVQLPTQTYIQTAYVQTVADDIIINGKTYGLPLAIDTLALYYNKDLLDAAGVPLPPKTWPELFEAVKKATKYDADGNIVQAGIAMGTGANIDNAYDILTLLMYQTNVTMSSGRQVTFAEGLQNRAHENHPAMQVLRFYTDFARDSKAIYSWNTSMPNAFESFIQGQSVFYLGYAFDAARIRARAPQMNVEVTTAPQLPDAAPINVANYWIESVLKKSKHQNEAWDFVRFMTLPQNVATYTAAAAQPSPLRTQVTAQLSNVTLAPFASQVLVAKNWYKGNNIDVVRKAFAAMADQSVAPLLEKEDQLVRDANAISRAAQVTQQTY